VDIKKYLGDKASGVNAALERLLPRSSDFPKNLNAAMRYSMFAGGKRLRPVLVLAGCEAVGGNAEHAMTTACAFECIHTYSLIHDDLPAMDNDDLRRGMPTCHKKFDEATAILAGDGLLTLAFELIAATGGVDKARLLEVTRTLARASGYMGMIGGQVLDIESEGKEVTFPLLEQIHISKTGALIAASVRCGALIGGAEGPILDKFTRYGDAVGLAFQVADDILNVESTAEELGKPVGSDEARKKATYPALVGLKQAKAMAAELVEKALGHIEGFDERAEPLRLLAKYSIERRK